MVPAQVQTATAIAQNQEEEGKERHWDPSLIVVHWHHRHRVTSSLPGELTIIKNGPFNSSSCFYWSFRSITLDLKLEYSP